MPAALQSAHVGKPITFVSADAEASTTDKPAADPVVAQQGGMSALDAAAAVSIQCDYRSGDDTLTVHLTASPVKAAANLLLPQVAHDAHLSVTQLRSVAATPPPADGIKLVGGSVALSGLTVDGGYGAVLVSSTLPDVRDEALRRVATTVVSQVRVPGT